MAATFVIAIIATYGFIASLKEEAPQEKKTIEKVTTQQSHSFKRKSTRKKKRKTKR